MDELGQSDPGAATFFRTDQLGQKLGVDLRRKRCRGDQAQRCDSVGIVQRKCDGNGTAQGMSRDVCSWNFEGLQKCVNDVRGE